MLNADGIWCVVLLLCCYADATSAGDSAHQKQLATQLAIIQESNSTLRDENARNLSRAKEWQAKSEQLQQQMIPIQQQIHSLQATIESLSGEKTALIGEVKSWKLRNDKLLDKYGAVDPEVHRKLKADLEALQTQFDTVSKELAAAKQETERAKQQKLAVELEITRLGGEVKAAQDEVKSSAQRLANAQKAANHFKTISQKTTKTFEEKLATAGTEYAALTTKLNEQNAKFTEQAQVLAAGEERLTRMARALTNSTRLIRAKDEKLSSLSIQHSTALIASGEDRKASDAKIAREWEMKIAALKKSYDAKLKKTEERAKV